MRIPTDVVPRAAGPSIVSLILAGCVTLMLSNYYFYYFVGFTQGVAGNYPLAFSFLKLTIVPIVLIMIDWRRGFRVLIHDLLLVAYTVSAIAIWVVKGYALGMTDTLFLNVPLSATALLLVVFGIKEKMFALFMRATVVVLVLQTLGDSALLAAGLSLWENRGFVGGVGNPSTFGFICNLAVAYLLLMEPGRIWRVIGVPILCYGVVMSNALFQVGLLSAILLYWATKSAWRMLGLSVSIGAVVGVVVVGYSALNAEDVLGHHVMYKLESAVSLVEGGSTTGGSVSVSNRVKLHEELASWVSTAPGQVLLIGFPDASYNGQDSQYVTVAGSFGLLVLGLFVLSLCGYFMQALFSTVPSSNFATISIAAFLGVFLVNRLLDYYPIAFYFFLVLAIQRMNWVGDAIEHRV